MATGNFPPELYYELTCPICKDYFTDPVTTVCEHNFCRVCLIHTWRVVQGRIPSCPLCRGTNQERRPKTNQQLANILEISTQFSLAEGAGDVCQRHQEPLTLFCRDDKGHICVLCHESEEHREHQVIPVEEAVEECKGKIQDLLEKRRQIFLDQEKAEEEKSQACLEQLQEKKQAITSALEEMRRHIQEKEQNWLRQLAGLEEEIKSRLEENVMRLSKETSHYSNLIKDVELQSQQPPSAFLQHLGDTLSRCLTWKMKEKVVPAPGPEWMLRSNLPKIAVLKKTVKALEGSLMHVLNEGNEVSVTLDPDTADPGLDLSEDLKRVWHRYSDLELPSNPRKFNLQFGVLGREIFTSGRHCWEVEVDKQTSDLASDLEMWAVGLAQESLARKGTVILCPRNGVWAVGKETSQSPKFLAYTLIVPTRVNLKAEPKRILVSLDYEAGRVEFLDADTGDLIFTFPKASFHGKRVRPFFWVLSGVCLKC